MEYYGTDFGITESDIESCAAYMHLLRSTEQAGAQILYSNVYHRSPTFINEFEVSY